MLTGQSLGADGKGLVGKSQRRIRVTITEGKYRVTVPDPGEYERAFAGDDELIFSIPAQKIDEFFAGIDHQINLGRSLNSYYPAMKEDFARPPFYNRVFESWGMATSELWDK